jgi:hypothetical protein
MVFERLELKIQDIPTSQCTKCGGVGIRLMSAPALVVEVFNERATHKLPDWNQQMARAKARDAITRKRLRAPLEGDMGQDIKVYNMDFGRTERDRLESKAQLDNI